MKIGEIITPNPACTTSYATLVEAAQKMKSLDVGMLPVCEGDRIVGSVTDRDIAIRAVAQDLDPKFTTVKDIMTQDLIYCFDDQDVKEAAHLMEERQIRRLPILNRQQQLVGIISIGDLVVRGGKKNLAGEILEHVSTPGL